MLLLPKLNALWRVPLILLVTGLLALTSVFFSVFDRTGRLQHRCARLWGRFILLVSRVRVDLIGLDRLTPGRGYILAANHLSMFDHWAFLDQLPFQFRFAAKATLFRIPLLGWHLKRAGNLPIDRFHPRRTVRGFENISSQIQNGLSLVIYPEGARTWGETILPFKRGPFLLAKSIKAPLVPVTIIGAHRRLARGSVIIYPGTMTMIIHDPIEYQDYCDQNLDELAQRVRNTIKSSYHQVDK